MVTVSGFVVVVLVSLVAVASAFPRTAQVGPRPYFLINDMDEGYVKKTRMRCEDKKLRRSKFAIGHRGAALQFPEHSKESWMAAAVQGAGVIECDVTFTKDRQLVCRHDQCDLHTTTNILLTPLAAKCTQPFSPAAGGKPASAKCCTSDLTLAEFKSLCGKMDAFVANASTVEEYVLDGTPNFRTDLYSTCGTVMAHKEYIELLKKTDISYTPELKTPAVQMPYEGDYTQEDYAQQMIDEYKAAGIPWQRVWAQSFLLDDILYWIKAEPYYGIQAVYLDSRYEAAKSQNPADWGFPSMQYLRDNKVNVIAPPQELLVKLSKSGKIVPSRYAIEAKKAGLEIISWTFERSGLLVSGGGFYYETVTAAINNDGDAYTMLDVLANKVKILGLFSDWPASVVYFANCYNLDRGVNMMVRALRRRALKEM